MEDKIYYNDEWNRIIEDKIMNTPIGVLKEIGETETIETTYYPRYTKIKKYKNDIKRTK